MDIKTLSRKYAIADLDFDQALRTWHEADLSPEEICEQISFDIGEDITVAEASEIRQASEALKSKDSILKEFGMAKGNEKGCPFYGVNFSNQNRKRTYGGGEAFARNYKVSEGRSELLPDLIKNKDKIKFTPAIRQALDRVGKNLFQDRIASKYWTLKEKEGEDGKKSIYLVAVEVDDSDVHVKKAQNLPAQSQEITNPSEEKKEMAVAPSGQPQQEVVNPSAPQEVAMGSQSYRPTGTISDFLKTKQLYPQLSTSGIKDFGRKSKVAKKEEK